MDQVIIRVEELHYTYPGRTIPAVDQMSFEVERGEVFGFLGPSGAGKTTAQRILIGLLRSRRGRVEVLGREPREWGPALYDRIGIAFELPVGYPRLTARQELGHFAQLHSGPTRDVGELLASLGLSEAADQPVGSYSKGMRIRLNLARALLHEPEVLFLDEPTSGLDPVNAAAVRDLIREEQRRGRTIFLTTHDMQTADDVCDRVAFVVDGRITACDPPRALRLRHGRADLRVEHRTDDGIATAVFPLGTASDALIALLASGRVETVHTTEATLDEVFAAVTGRQL